jgi:hypothetical protein
MAISEGSAIDPIPVLRDRRLSSIGTAYHHRAVSLHFGSE